MKSKSLSMFQFYTFTSSKILSKQNLIIVTVEADDRATGVEVNYHLKNFQKIIDHKRMHSKWQRGQYLLVSTILILQQFLSNLKLVSMLRAFFFSLTISSRTCLTHKFQKFTFTLPRIELTLGNLRRRQVTFGDLRS